MKELSGAGPREGPSRQHPLSFVSCWGLGERKAKRPQGRLGEGGGGTSVQREGWKAGLGKFMTSHQTSHWLGSITCILLNQWIA